MSKSIFLFKLNNNFSFLNNEENLEILLDIYYKSLANEFYKSQLNLLIDEIDINLIKDNLLNLILSKSNSIVEENKIIIKNEYKNQEEKLFLFNNYLKLEFIEKSIILEYLSLYFIDLIAIDTEEEKIYPLHLVKSNILV
jgi:hypothetical protein